MTKEIEIHLLPVLVDNYIYVIRDTDNNLTTVVDPAESAPVLNFLEEKNWPLTHILISHHHGDHIGGVKKLKQATNCTVIGAKIDSQRLPPLDREVSEGQTVTLGSLTLEVVFLPGHTLGHIAYISESPAIAFTGDVVFGMGCGRIFEGTMEQAYQSLQKIKKLNPATLIYCTHEYTEKNGRFACQQRPDNGLIAARFADVVKERKSQKPTVPLKLIDELATNPFLLAESVSEFTELRAARNVF